MNRTVVVCSLVLSIGSFAGACTSTDPPGNGDDATGGTTSGSSGTAGASGTTGGAGAATGGATSTGGDTSGGSSSGTSGAGGSSTGGAGSGGDAGGGGGTSGASSGSGSGGTSGGGGGASAGRANGGAGGTAGAGGSSGGAHAMMNLFVTSDTSMTGNLGGLGMADMRCQTLAAAVGHGSKTWVAYLSVATPMTHAINRIGEGPYYNSTGAMVAMTKAALHTRMGDAAVFLDERGNRINGQWQGSPTPNQHDILTGTQQNGMLSMGNTCADWTATTGNAQVGHSDGLGPNMSMTGNVTIWNGSHTAPCGNLAQTGGAGKLYCFVAP